MEIEEHLVALKVMRLTRPTLASPFPVTCDTKDLPGNLLNIALQQDITAVQCIETVSIGQFLLLPQSPVNIYLGETFSSYICVHNETKDVVLNVAVKVDLQTTSQRLPLPTNPPTSELPGDDTVNNVIHHEVKELGAHILVCEVSYQTPNGVPMSFRKFFKIHVLKPLDVKTKFYNAESDDVYLEAQVQNITSGPICLEKVSLEASPLFADRKTKFCNAESSEVLVEAQVQNLTTGPIHLEKVTLEPSSLYMVTSLNHVENGESVFGPTTLLQPQSSCQFLYCLTPQPELTTDLKALSNATNIGKLDIVWRSNLGERGRLQTSQLQRMPPSYEDIRLTLIELPNFVKLEEEFHLKCRLVNNCERTVELILHLEITSSLLWCGVSGCKLPPLAPGASYDLPLSAIPLRPGLQFISGIKLQDIFLIRTYKYDEIGQIFVQICDDND